MIDGRDSIVIGAPGGLAFWTFEVLRALAKKSQRGSIEVSTIGVGKPVPEASHKSDARILLTNYPGAEFIDAIEQKGVPVLYLSEPPICVVRYLCEATKRTVIESVRVCSASYVANLALRRAKNAIILDRGMDITVADAIGAMCQHLKLTIDADDVNAYAAHVAPGQPKKTTLDSAIVRFLRTEIGKDAEQSGENSASNLVAAILDPLAA